MRIFLSGSLAYDRIMNFPGRFSDHILPEKIHILNVAFNVSGLKEKFGGTAGNIAYNLSLLGEKPVIVATCGRDFDRYEQWLGRNGLPLDGIERLEDEVTGGAYITTDLSDNQITAFNPGAMGFPTHYRFDQVDPAAALAIISPGNLDDMRSYPRTFREIKLPFLMDPGQSIPMLTGRELAEMIAGSEILISNDYELEMIQKATGLTLAQLLERTKAVITTLGELGSRIVTPAGETRISPAKVAKVLDPTGAGDAYRAGLIKGLVSGWKLVQAAGLGSTCASFAVEAYGTQEHHFTQSEFRVRYEENYGEMTEGILF
ncbi:MAG: carbohydrate kinase family protein [Thermodesulfobacteriota bacterium]